MAASVFVTLGTPQVFIRLKLAPPKPEELATASPRGGQPVSVPDVFDLTLPVLRLLADGEAWSTERLAADLAGVFDLSSETLARTRTDGRNLFGSQIGWARTWLKNAALIEYPGPSRSRITQSGQQLLASQPQRLGMEFFKAGHDGAAGSTTLLEGCSADGETLEDELRRLSGSAVKADGDWEAVCLINGWGLEPPMSYKRVAQRLERPMRGLLALGKKCLAARPDEAPMLDAALSMTLEHPDRDPELLSLDLAMIGITRGAFCLPGLCEAARRFGRTTEWQRLVRYLAENRGRNRRPRPFESWFELDVYLDLIDLGYDVRPQKKIARYRVDLFVPDLVPQVVVECDGNRYHTAERAESDEIREKWLGSHGYRVVRFRWSDYVEKPRTMKEGLADVMQKACMGSQLKLA